MNLQEELLREHSKVQTRKLATYIGSNQKRFNDLMSLFFDGHYRLNQRAAAVLNECQTKQPQLVNPYLDRLISNLENKGIHDAVKRNTIRLLQFMDIPEKHKGELYDICFAFLISAEEPIAIKAFSMCVLANICKTYPELKNELIPVLEDLIPHGSSGIKNSGKKILAELDKL